MVALALGDGLAGAVGQANSAVLSSMAATASATAAATTATAPVPTTTKAASKTNGDTCLNLDDSTMADLNSLPGMNGTGAVIAWAHGGPVGGSPRADVLEKMTECCHPFGGVTGCAAWCELTERGALAVLFCLNDTHFMVDGGGELPAALVSVNYTLGNSSVNPNAVKNGAGGSRLAWSTMGFLGALTILMGVVVG